MAASVSLVPTLPEEHAAPALTDMPARSSCMTSVSALRPGGAIKLVLGSLGLSAPMMQASRVVAQSSRSSRSRNRARPANSRSPRRAAAAAAPNPAMPATFSVPARLRRSWPPPRIKAGRLVRAHDESADARRAAQLVRRERDEIGVEAGAVDLSARLHGIGKHGEAMRPCRRRRLGQGLEDAGLVVGRLQRKQGRTGLAAGVVQRRGEGIHVEAAIRARRVLDDPGRGCERGSEHGGMLQPRQVDRPAMSLQHRVAGLRRAAREHDVGGLCADQRGDLFARRLDQGARAPAIRMHGRRIAEHIERREHCSPRLGAQRRRGVVVEVCPRLVHCAAHIRLSASPGRAAGIVAGMPSSTSCSDTLCEERGDVRAQRMPEPVRQAPLLAQAGRFAGAAPRHAGPFLDGGHDLGDGDVARRAPRR